MAHEVTAADYGDVVLFLATAGIVVPLFRRWKISPILGFIGAGVALGPFGLGSLQEAVPWLAYITIKNPVQVAQLAGFGVVFLLFSVGLELSWERLKAMRTLVFGLGGLQVGACGAAIAAIGWATGLDPLPAILLGTASALSSTAIVMPLLAEQNRQYSQAGRATFAVLLFQDLMVAPILVTLAFLGSRTGEGFSVKLLIAFAPAAAGVVALVVLGRLLLRPIMKSVARARSEELFMAACLLIVVGAGLLASVAGLSMALGAFVAGLLLAETEYRKEVERTVEPFKGLLLGLFFVSVGISLDIGVLTRQPLRVVAIMLVFLAINGMIIFVLARVFRFTSVRAVEIALLLAATGEFSFVILQTALDEGLIERGLVHTVFVSGTLSMFSLPLLAAAAAKVRQWRPEAPQPVDHEIVPPLPSKVVVVGFGRVGQLVAEMLTTHDVSWLAIERSTIQVEAARKKGLDVLYGDAARPEFLRRCGLDTARALVVTMDSPDGAEAVVATAREMRPDLVIVARARDAQQAKQLYRLGASNAIPETVEASLQLSEAVLVDLGIPMGLVIASIHERRDGFRRELNDPRTLGGARPRSTHRPPADGRS